MGKKPANFWPLEDDLELLRLADSRDVGKEDILCNGQLAHGNGKRPAFSVRGNEPNFPLVRALNGDRRMNMEARDDFSTRKIGSGKPVGKQQSIPSRDLVALFVDANFAFVHNAEPLHISVMARR